MAFLVDVVGSKRPGQVILLQMILGGTVLCGNVLIWPPESSHWMNMRTIVMELVDRGHNVTVVLPSSSSNDISRDPPSLLRYEIFQVSFGGDYFMKLVDEMMTLWMYEKQYLNTWQFYWRFSDLAARSIVLSKDICNGVLKNPVLMERLSKSNFDVLLTDPVFFGGELVALTLGIPFVYSLRFTPASTTERHCGKIPSPPSYVPATLSELTDKMSLSERIENFVFYIVQDAAFESMWGEWDSYYSSILGKQTTFCETMGKAEIWLIRTYWDFEYPRPMLPNFEFVGGLHCQPAKPLPEDMEAFVQSSGDHGIVVFSLGSMVKNLTDEKSNMIAAALSQIPQKVLWRYSGKKPDTLGPNTMLYDWMPQNDLLGHPKTKAFISHGGTNGIYEAIYHGIPMVGIPLFADQPDNMAHMKSKGMAIVLDFNTMKTQDLVDAVNTVIANSTYKENALRLSTIHHDQPMKPLDRAVFWIEFVMRHKGAKHLRPASHNLTWYQYHCLDVIAFLLACVLVIVFTIVKCCLFFFRKCVRIAKRKKD